MAKRETIIEINGKRYDARTGALLSSSTAPVSRPVRSVDGMLSSAQAVSHAHMPKKAVPTAIPHPQAVNRPTGDIHRAGVKHVAHHAPKKSQTLIRSAVTKPAPASLKRSAKSTSHSHAVVPAPNVAIVKRLSHPTVDQHRAKRAQDIARSEQIRRYALDSDGMKPVSASASPYAAGIKPVYASAPAAHAVAQPLPGASSMDIFEQALQHANSHLETPPAAARKNRKKKSGTAKRVFGIAATSLAVLVLTGFVVLQNQANLTVRYASHKAGFSANLPAYKPAGYTPGKFSYNVGSVAVKFNNPSSGQSFALVQKTSQWDSDALLSNFVASKDPNYQALQSAGRIIYTYGKNSATWVNGGVWYQIESNGNLSTSDLVNVATSM